jgi:hypothetical protein
VTGWLVPSAGLKIPVQLGWYLPLVCSSQYSLAGTFRWCLPPLKKIPLAENRFLQAGKGSENTKEKSRQCFSDEETLIRMKAGAQVPEETLIRI